jgi:hypothetical protein
MRTHLKLFLALSLGAGGISLAGCEERYDEDITTPPPPAGTTDTTWDRAREGAQDMGRDVQERLDRTGDTIDRGIDRAQEGLRRTGDNVRDGVSTDPPPPPAPEPIAPPPPPPTEPMAPPPPPLPPVDEPMAPPPPPPAPIE